MVTKCVWSFDKWCRKSSELQYRVKRLTNEAEAIRQVMVQARQVLRSYSTSFYLVTRFLPVHKRRQVELIYAAVRYPDELVDTFSQQGLDVGDELDRWESDYRMALGTEGLLESVSRGLNPFVAAFAEVVKKHAIPIEYYSSFMQAMRTDLEPQEFHTVEDLIDGYVYGSATVVGYFLTHVYGTEREDDFQHALKCARDLAIALQLTNFARDISDDFYRGRLYAPLEKLGHSSWNELQSTECSPPAALLAARIWLAETARDKYAAATGNLHLFSRDSRVAIECCIKVYSLLNEQILESGRSLSQRLSVPWYRKFAALPASKYWRVPLAYSGII